MTLPLVEAGQVLGALDVQSTEADAFSNEDLETSASWRNWSASRSKTRNYTSKWNGRSRKPRLLRAGASAKIGIALQMPTKSPVTGYTAGSVEPIPPSKDEDGHAAQSSDRKQVAVPIVMRGLEIGELAVTIPQDENIKADQMDMIRAVADRVAVIAENARLFDETTRRAERERLVTEITTKIRGNNDPQAMIETAVRELREALKVSRVDIIPQKNKSPDR